jgi:hypothetical protein
MRIFTHVRKNSRCLALCGECFDIDCVMTEIDQETIFENNYTYYSANITNQMTEYILKSLHVIPYLQECFLMHHHRHVFISNLTAPIITDQLHSNPSTSTYIQVTISLSLLHRNLFQSNET